MTPFPSGRHRAVYMETKEGTAGPLWRVFCACGIRRCWYATVEAAEQAHDAHALHMGRAK